MSHFDFQVNSLSSQNLRVMQAYALRNSTAKAAAEDYDGWLGRIETLPEFTAKELVLMHGQLIALGFLKFEISGRSVGLRYQISSRGRQALERATAVEDEGDRNSGLADAA